MSIRIDRCVCTGHTFADLLSQARRQGLDLDELMFESRAGLGCGLCRPYLRRAVETGETVFHEIMVEPGPAR